MKLSSRFTLWSTAIAVLFALILASTILSASTQPQLSARQRTGQANDAGVDVNLSDLPDMSVTDSFGAKEAEDPRIPGLAASSQRSVSLPEMGSHPLIPSGGPGQATPGGFIDFNGASEGCNGSGWVPSDMGIAVSATYVVQVVNECLEVFNKSGTLVAGPKDYCSLFGLAPNSGTHGCFDPRALYDTQAGKFVITGSYQDSNDNGYLLIATASNPTGVWHSHIISEGALLADYPTVGQTAYLNNPYNSVYTTCYNAYFNSGAFYDVCSFFPKKQINSVLKSWAIWEDFTLGGVVQNTLQAIDSYEITANPRAQFVVNSLNDGGAVCGNPESGLLVWAESNATGAGGGSHLSGWFTGCGSTETYSEPASADNSTFCSACVETLDNRISAKSFWANGNIRVSLDAYNGYSSAALGWTLVPTLDDNGGGCTGGYLCPNITGVTVAQQFCYDCGGGQGAQAWFGAIATTAGGDWTQWATFSNNAVSPGPFYTTNNVTWASPFHDSGVYACVNDFSWSGRWGDYNAAAPDEPGTNTKNVAAIWGSGMELINTGTWGSCISGNNPETP
jgi:hypothetical protein